MTGWLGRASEHERVEALLSAYLDGRTTQAERAFIEQHVQSCESCTRSLTTLRATVAAVRDMPHVRAPRSFALPRSMARQPRPIPWTYPLLRTATVIAILVFVITVGADLLTRSPALPAAVPQIAAPAALPPTSIAMESARALEPTSAPQRAALATPLPTFLASQADSSAATASAAIPSTVTAQQPVAPPAPAPQTQTLGLPAAPSLSTPLAASKAAPPAANTEITPPIEEPLTDAGLGGGGQAPGARGQPPAFQPGEAATLEGPTPTAPVSAPAAPAPTQIARNVAPLAPAPQPPTAGAREYTYSIQRPTTIRFRVAEGALAVLVITLGAAAWVARRRNR
jgi:hypothetical protein